MNTNWLKARQTKYGAVRRGLPGRHHRGAGDRQLAGQHAQQVRGHHLEQALQSVRSDEEGGAEPEADVNIKYFDQQKNFGTAKDLLDRYNNLSSKLHVEYIDPDKKPSVAKAMGVKNYGATYILANGKTEEAKSVTEEEVTGALVRALKGGAAHGVLRERLGRAQPRQHRAHGYSNVKEALEKNNYKTGPSRCWA